MLFFPNPFAMDDSPQWPEYSSMNWGIPSRNDRFRRQAPSYQPMWPIDDYYRQPCRSAARSRNDASGFSRFPLNFPFDFVGNRPDTDSSDDDNDDANDNKCNVRTQRGSSLPPQMTSRHDGGQRSRQLQGSQKHHQGGQTDEHHDGQKTDSSRQNHQSNPMKLRHQCQHDRKSPNHRGLQNRRSEKNMDTSQLCNVEDNQSINQQQIHNSVLNGSDAATVPESWNENPIYTTARPSSTKDEPSTKVNIEQPSLPSEDRPSLEPNENEGSNEDEQKANNSDDASQMEIEEQKLSVEDNNQAAQKGPAPKETPKQLSATDRLTGVGEELNALEKRIEAFKVEKSERERIVLDELLTKVLLSLDAIEANGNDEIRQSRRELVRKAQSLASQLED